MPKKTFFNLPEKKRKRIIDAAIKEFSIYSFSKSSVNRIVKNSKISKGSFYQYFENKKDLYKYIIDLIAETKLKYLNDIINKNIDKIDIFSLMKNMTDVSLKFIKDFPEFAQIGYLFLNEDEQFIEEITGNLNNKGEKMIFSLLKQAQEKGEIYENIDLKFTSFLILNLNNSILEYVKKHKTDLSWDEMADLSNQIIFIFENGIKKKEGDYDKNK
ncbi:TetR family transcriptional regulator [Marinitoga sp. 1197]|uniref:TetR/AcrR family transcriptional regulator n=1 Tax=Marinitoga sp. 1197 TaxID=1428449 RepID=UPI000640CB34|nr:TetR/AcrR family transcriptional regulator [Marinitoga sp. 1197]KLO21529.1 TetR family transcriptional regulator [Marinitoga sp. 1197]